MFKHHVAILEHNWVFQYEIVQGEPRMFMYFCMYIVTLAMVLVVCMHTWPLHVNDQSLFDPM